MSVIHAGAILWHLRRFSTDAFYEAPAVALATLTLWAFGVFSDKCGQSRHSDDIQPGEGSRHGVTGTRSADNGNGNIGEDGEDPIEDNNDDGCPDMILLDRPADDELVQQFIRRGDSMEARLSGVGDIFSVKGPELVLREGSKLLESTKSVCGGFETWRTLIAGLAAQWKPRSPVMRQIMQQRNDSV